MMPHLKKAKPEYRFYDQGWNDRVANKPQQSSSNGASRDYRDGWRDCDEAPIEQRSQLN